MGPTRALAVLLSLLALGAASAEQVQLVAQPLASTESTSNLIKCGKIDGSTGSITFYPDLPDTITLSGCTWDVVYSGTPAGTPAPTTAPGALCAACLASRLLSSQEYSQARGQRV